MRSMKKIPLFFSLLIFIFNASAQDYKLTDANSKVEFEIDNNLVFKTTVDGTLSGLTGQLHWDEKDVSNSKVSASVKISTIETGIKRRNRHLQEEEYFNAQKYPTITITSTEIKAGKEPKNYILYGKITMKGITKHIQIPFVTTHYQNKLLLSAQFKLNRKEFGIGPDNSISDELLVKLAVMAEE